MANTGIRELTTNVGGIIKRIWYALNGTTPTAELMSIDDAGKFKCVSEQISGLAGTGNRMVVADASGNLSASLQVETGDWTPVLRGDISGVAVAGALNKGKYTKIGNLVMFSAYVNWTSISGTIAGNRIISGLPYNCGVSVRGSTAIGMSIAGSVTCGANRTLSVMVELGNNYMYLGESDLQNGGTFTDTVKIGSSGILYSISGFYYTD